MVASSLALLLLYRTVRHYPETSTTPKDVDARVPKYLSFLSRNWTSGMIRKHVPNIMNVSNQQMHHTEEYSSHGGSRPEETRPVEIKTNSTVTTLVPTTPPPAPHLPSKVWKPALAGSDTLRLLDLIRIEDERRRCIKGVR